MCVRSFLLFVHSPVMWHANFTEPVPFWFLGDLSCSLERQPSCALTPVEAEQWHRMFCRMEKTRPQGVSDLRLGNVNPWVFQPSTGVTAMFVRSKCFSRAPLSFHPLKVTYTQYMLIKHWWLTLLVFVGYSEWKHTQTWILNPSSLGYQV